MRGSAQPLPVTEQPPGDDLEALLRRLIAETIAAGSEATQLTFEAGRAYERSLATAKPPERRRRAGGGYRQSPILRSV